MLQRPAGSAGDGGSFGIPSVLQDASVEAARKPRIGPKRDCCSTGLHSGNDRTRPRHMRQQGSDGAKLRQPHHNHDQATQATTARQ